MPQESHDHDHDHDHDYEAHEHEAGEHDHEHEHEAEEHDSVSHDHDEHAHEAHEHEHEHEGHSHNHASHDHDHAGNDHTAPTAKNRSSSHGHNHSHAHGGDGNIGVAFLLNLSFTIIELFGGLFTNSIAIMSDAVHDFGDSLSLALAWYFQRKSKQGSTHQYTYGYKRFSLLGAIITSVVLVVGSLYILSEAIPRILSPQETNASGMFLLAVLGIVINGIAVLRTRNAASINERVVSLHLLEDVLGWAAVLVGSVVMYFTELTIIDPLLSIGIACFVLFNVVKNVRAVMAILLQSTPDGIERDHIVAKLSEIEQVDDVHDLHIWSLDEEYNVLTVHLALNENLSMQELAVLKERVRAMLESEDIQHATIEFETPDEACHLASCASESL